MRVISRRSLCRFWQQIGKEDAQTPLELWYHDTLKAEWRTPHDIKQYAANASFCANNRVVFNVGGNKYRLVVEVQYKAAIVWVKFVGTHAEYDKINVETVNDY